MLKEQDLISLSEADRELYEQIVPEDHFLRRLLQAVDFEAFRPILTAAYSSDLGRPAVDPVRVLKLEVLARHYHLSDREVMTDARYNIAYRLFLGLSLKSPLPHHTGLTYFRQRLGAERLQHVFDELVGQARRLGLVKDRLRLKDATHIIANIAVPSTIRLVAEVRDQLLAALRRFAAERVAEEQQRAEAIRGASADTKDDDRLVQRVAHLRAVLAWADAVPQQPSFTQASPEHQEPLRAALELAHQVLADREQPDTGNKILSIHDVDARRGKHGDFYDGYLYDVAMDADSELITAVNVLPANGDEGADAVYLLAAEQQAQGNHVAALSMDGAGYRGELLRELTDPDGLNVEVFVPPTARVPVPVFSPGQFTRSADGKTLTCPAGQTTTRQEHHRRDTGTQFRFAPKQCGACPLRARCLTNPETKARTVIKNAYEAEYLAAQIKAWTPEYARIRKQHPAIERKLSELVNRHGMRRARYRGRRGVWRQGLLTALVVNLKRIVRLLGNALAPPASAGTVRAAWAAEE